MLEFITREIVDPIGSIEAACLVSKPGDASEGDDGVIKDDALLPLPGQLVAAIAETADRCETMEKSGAGVDCGTFGTLVLGGIYNPVSEAMYTRGLHRRIEFGRWWEGAEILGSTATAELVQFCLFNGRPMPRHVAVKLPDTQGQYIQKIGHGLPIAICGAIPNFRFHGANAVASINTFTATRKGKIVMSYESNQPDTLSVGTYIGLPG